MWNQLFEGENREVYRRRDFIQQLAAVKPGMHVADIGAGTGIFTVLLSDAVGPDGRVYAEEVVAKFNTFIAERAMRDARKNVVSVLGTEHGIGLPPNSIDFAFLCDVYHHFDYPNDMLASIRAALRKDGEILLVDFRREPGRSPAWLLDHVRAGEQVVRDEFERAGFTLLSSDHSLHDNYALRFRVFVSTAISPGPAALRASRSTTSDR